MLNRRYQPRYERTIFVFFSSAHATVDTIISLLNVVDCGTKTYIKYVQIKV